MVFHMYVALCPSHIHTKMWPWLGFVTRPYSHWLQTEGPTKNCAATMSALGNLFTSKEKQFFSLSSDWKQTTKSGHRVTKRPWSFSLHNSFGWSPLELADKREAVTKTSHQAQVPSLPVSHKPHKHLGPRPLQMCANHSQGTLNSWDYSGPASRN